MKVLLAIWFWAGWAIVASASHIIGGYISYRHLGQFNYEITLTVYRDCYNGIPGFDNPAYVAVYRSNGTIYQQLELTDPQITLLDAAHHDPCIIVPGTVCVQEGVYKDTIYLAPGPTHYDITYQRCCRNGTILNIQQPANTGATYTARVPRVTVATPYNNSPVFKNIPPITICRGEPLITNQSAIDADGDSLVYQLCQPLSGQFGTVAQPNPPAPPPYSPVAYQSGYSAQVPLPASPGLLIDPTTGIITGTPTVQGQFVVGICVSEYRNGQLINTYLRDFQFNVVSCPKMAAVAPVIDTIWCQPYTVQFSNQSINASGYQWDFGDPTTTNDQSALPNPSYTYPATGRYTVQLVAFNSYGCRDTAYTDVLIKKGASAQFVHSAPCKHPDIIFTDVSTSGKGPVIKRTWNLGDGTTDTGSVVRHTYSTAGQYMVSLMIETSDGCLDTITRQIKYQPAPVADFADLSVCAGDTLTLQSLSGAPGSSISTELWKLNGQMQSGPVSSWHLQAGTYPATLIVTNQIGCTDSITKSITIYPEPNPHINGDNRYCEGDTILWQATGGITYTWQFPGFSDTGSVVSWQPAGTQLVSLTAIDTNGCSATIHKTITQHPIPYIAAGPDTMLCPGDTISLYASGAAHYQWSPQVNTVNGQPTLIAQKTESILVTGTDSNGCVAKDTVNITVRNLPAIQLTPSQTTICDGEAVGLLAQGASSYTWSPALGLSCTQCPNPIAQLATSQVFTVVGTDQFGCRATDSVAITLFSRTHINFPGDTAICDGDSLQVTISPITDVHWVPGTGLNCDTCSNVIASPANTTLYKARFTDSNGCPRDSQWLLTVYPKPQINWTPAQPAYCIGDSLQLQLQGANSWQWIPSPWLSCFTCPDPIIKAPTGITVETTGINGFGCRQTVQIPVTVHPLPIPDLGPDTTICIGDSLILAVPSGQQFTWKADHSILGCTNCQQTVVKPLAPARVYLSLVDQFGCKGSDTLDIDLHPFVNVQAGPDTAVCMGEPVELIAANGIQYSWLPAYLGNAPDSSHNLIRPTKSITATLQATDTVGCTVESHVHIEVWPLPWVDAGPNQTRYRHETIQLTASGTGDFQWEPSTLVNPADQAETTVQLASPQVFTVTLTDVHGCQSSDSLFIDIKDPGRVVMPNAFSPNGDGLNDQFIPYVSEAYFWISLQIFNRWGELIYENQDGTGWNGTAGGQMLPIGTYVYRFTYGTPYGHNEMMQGNLLLIR